jgi:hypothetical protein
MIGMPRQTYGRWPWASAALVVPAATAAAVRRGRLARDGRWVAGLALPILLAHQTEEWVRPGGFLPFANQRLLGSELPTFPLTERLGFWINVPLGWGTAAGGLLLWRRTPALAGAVVGIELANVAMHGGMAARERRYNPGVVTASTLLLPHALAGAWWLARSRRARIATLAAAAAGLSSGVLAPPLLKRRRPAQAVASR